MIAALELRDIAVRRGGPSQPDPTTLIAAHLFLGGLSELVIAWLDHKIDTPIHE
jgi:hypothetical protein